MSANRIWGVATALAILLILALGWLLVVSPMLGQAAQADEERVAIEGNNAAQQVVLDGLIQKAANVEQYRAELTALRDSSIPATPDLRDLFVYLEDVADAANVSLLGATVDSLALYGSEAEAEPAVPLPTGRLAETLYRQNLTMTVAGSTEDVLDFVHRLQTSTASPGRLVYLPSLTIQMGSESTAIQGYVFLIDDSNVPASVTEPSPAPQESPAPEESAAPAPEETPAPAPSVTP